MSSVHCACHRSSIAVCFICDIHVSYLNVPEVPEIVFPFCLVGQYGIFAGKCLGKKTLCVNSCPCR
jgi:hypothetical protein